MAFNIFLIITILTSLQLLLLDISDIFMVFILPVKVSFLICPLCSLYHGECSAVGPGAFKPSVGDGIEYRRPCSALHFLSIHFLYCLSILHLYWCVHQSIIIIIMYPAQHDLYKMLIKITDILIFFFHKTVSCVCFEPISLLAMYVGSRPGSSRPPANHRTQIRGWGCTSARQSSTANVFCIYNSPHRA